MCPEASRLARIEHESCYQERQPLWATVRRSFLIHFPLPLYCPLRHRNDSDFYSGLFAVAAFSSILKKDIVSESISAWLESSSAMEAISSLDEAFCWITVSS